MAGDWIKMRTDLAGDPAVVAIAEATGLDEDHVVGKLHRLWSWADKHTHDGNARSVTYSWVDRYLGVQNFAMAMEESGWLSHDGGTLSIPNFNSHNGQSAKARALTAKRVSNARSVTSALPREEKRREESIPTKVGIRVPKIEQVREYIELKKYNIDAEQFWHYYEARGWRTKQGPIRSWKSAIVTWVKNEKIQNSSTPPKPRAKLLTPEQEKLFTAETMTTGLLADGTSIL